MHTLLNALGMRANGILAHAHIKPLLTTIMNVAHFALMVALFVVNSVKLHLTALIIIIINTN